MRITSVRALGAFTGAARAAPPVSGSWPLASAPDDVLTSAQMGFGPDRYAVGQAGVMVAAGLGGKQGTESVVLLSQDLQEWQTVEHPHRPSANGGLFADLMPIRVHLGDTLAQRQLTATTSRCGFRNRRSRSVEPERDRGSPAAVAAPLR